MTTKASDLAARFATSAAGTRRVSPAVVQPDPTPSQELPGRPVSLTSRIMVLLPKAQHRFIRQFSLNCDTDMSTVVRSLIARIENDPIFAEELRTTLGRTR